jgi:hypothetical protein
MEKNIMCGTRCDMSHEQNELDEPTSRRHAVIGCKASFAVAILFLSRKKMCAVKVHVGPRMGFQKWYIFLNVVRLFPQQKYILQIMAWSIKYAFTTTIKTSERSG